jgi:N utilization substance protein B
MQCIYALVQAKDGNLEEQQKFLKGSMENMYSLYLLMLALLVELQAYAQEQLELGSKKYLNEGGANYPDPARFAHNALLQQLTQNGRLKEDIEKRKLNNWYLHEDYIKIIYKEILTHKAFEAYMAKETTDYDTDKALVVKLFKEVIAPNEKIYEHFEDDKLTWVDDIPIVNTFLLKRLKQVKEEHPESYFLPKLLKDTADMTYAKDLMAKTLLKDAELTKEFEAKTPNWDKDRIAEIDAILLKMAICELLYFPSIPEKVTLNEYLEVAKEYSTPKSSIFINGVLDKLVKEYKTNGKMKKMGRGLL